LKVQDRWKWACSPKETQEYKKIATQCKYSGLRQVLIQKEWRLLGYYAVWLL
jgi:hypothetical protein